MNLFWLDPDPQKCAEYHVDKHVVKQILEAAQILATAYPGTAPYKITHRNHPCCIFVRESLENFEKVLDYAEHLGKEYTFRYGKIHKTTKVLEWYRANTPDLQRKGLTEFPRAFGDSGVGTTDCVYRDYREYYITAKRKLFSWKNRITPQWAK